MLPNPTPIAANAPDASSDFFLYPTTARASPSAVDPTARTAASPEACVAAIAASDAAPATTSVVFPEDEVDEDEEETAPEFDDAALSATTPARLPFGRPEFDFSR
jgi:hypothetical protein